LSGPSYDPTINYGISATGYYKITLSLSSGFKQITATPQFKITSGGSIITNCNFGVYFNAPFLSAFAASPITFSPLTQLAVQLLG
jgi:hypothetical protein